MGRLDQFSQFLFLVSRVHSYDGLNSKEHCVFGLTYLNTN